MLRFSLSQIVLFSLVISCSNDRNVENDSVPVEETQVDTEVIAKVGDWDTSPRLLFRPTPQDKYSNEGDVVLLLRSKADGTVESVSIIESSTHPELDSLALSQARMMIFKPATKEGKPISAQFYFPMSFRLR